MTRAIEARLAARSGHSLRAVTLRLGDSTEVVAAWETGRAELEARPGWAETHSLQHVEQASPVSVGTVGSERRQFGQNRRR